MKRVLTIAFALLLVVATSAAAQNPPQAPPRAQGTGVGPNFVDANGDGICDNFQAGNRAGRMQGRGGFGPGDGTGRRGMGPRDGSGYGPGGQTGTGICDGTGPKGRGRGPRR